MRAQTRHDATGDAVGHAIPWRLTGSTGRTRWDWAGRIRRDGTVKEDTSWFDRADQPEVVHAQFGRPTLKAVRVPEPAAGTVPVYDLKVAAGAFSAGQAPEVIGNVRLIDGPKKKGLFVAQVVGDSMDKVAPKGAWCMWQDLSAAGVAAHVSGEDLVVVRPGGGDPELGEYTFKQLVEVKGEYVLVPKSNNPEHRPIPVAAGAEIGAVARLVGIVGIEEG